MERGTMRLAKGIRSLGSLPRLPNYNPNLKKQVIALAAQAKSDDKTPPIISGAEGHLR
jgi:hypothetical protein